MNVSCKSTIGGWQSAVNNASFGPSMHKLQELWAWQRTVLQPQTLTPEQVAMLGAVLEYAINQSGNGKNPPIFSLACELFHNLNLGE